MNLLKSIAMNSPLYIYRHACSSIIIALCVCTSTVQAQQHAQLVQDMYSTSVYMGSTDSYNADDATRVSGLNGSMASSWTPANNGYMVTPVGAGYSGGVGYANGYIGSTKGGPHRVSPGGGLGEPGTPVGDIPVWFLLLLAGGCAVAVHHKTSSKSPTR